MAVKSFELTDPNSCLNKAADNEPLFVLRAQDSLAPTIIRAWAARARRAGCSEDKVQEAYVIAEEMEHWPNRKLPD